MSFLLVFMFGIALSSMTYVDASMETSKNKTNNDNRELNFTNPFYNALSGRFLDVKELSHSPLVTKEYFLEQGVISGVGNVTNNQTFINTHISNELTIGNGNGTITTVDGESIDWLSLDVGKTEEHESVYRGIMVFKNSTNGKLSFLDNSIGIYQSTEDQARSIWLWK